ncbi:MAG: tRNA 2-thiouridine(34) synthase MnmA [Gammaproteobacteria bacterium]|nr:tRNA 2-thiouridine(34) synthase MnmA [Rhodocyclaceae bacterium]MBU3909593.1 tRNA 2-thiouridine(34) synthase MnmA [Gammaproteobacteria bacterium]MBU3989155.1 tRNA 2-thiouridine(34) synthase MnmA [Gammaproteobacteria bacterium]MBU4003256.1 tRNA 2-thiouridine(34) synthase MnmA [Gammaproteobacteria bacterium]MBU4022305.1 tRNA 2-thiouridine(34) synthase MnmA [Gammaproteobacteria bacterium]
MKRVIVGMSGGVDSAVAALLLKRQGYAVTGVFMKNWEGDDTDDYCSSRQDLIDAAAAADAIGIELEAVNFAAEYRDRVFADFLSEYQAGRTPNPDVLCNSEIKFKAFLDHAMHLGADMIATGHYAQVREFLGVYQLMKAEDGTKDQSYFLYRLNQAQLAKTLFPVGHLYKREVRRIAEEAGLPNCAKKDSTGICFIGERPFREFLARYLPKQPGEIRRIEDDRVIGRHEGLMYYTLGQREGLGIGGVKGAPEEPWFVAAKEMQLNVLYVVQGHDHPALLRDRLTAGQLSWVSGKPPHTHWVYAAKTRYRMPDAACDIESLADGRCEIAFATPQWAVTPGQSAVLYESQVCLGGGVIL